MNRTKSFLGGLKAGIALCLALSTLSFAETSITLKEGYYFAELLSLLPHELIVASKENKLSTPSGVAHFRDMAGSLKLLQGIADFNIARINDPNFSTFASLLWKENPWVLRNLGIADQSGEDRVPLFPAMFEVLAAHSNEDIAADPSLQKPLIDAANAIEQSAGLESVMIAIAELNEQEEELAVRLAALAVFHLGTETKNRVEIINREPFRYFVAFLKENGRGRKYASRSKSVKTVVDLIEKKDFNDLANDWDNSREVIVKAVEDAVKAAYPPEPLKKNPGKPISKPVPEPIAKPVPEPIAAHPEPTLVLRPSPVVRTTSSPEPSLRDLAKKLNYNKKKADAEIASNHSPRTGESEFLPLTPRAWTPGKLNARDPVQVAEFLLQISHEMIYQVLEFANELKEVRVRTPDGWGPDQAAIKKQDAAIAIHTVVKSLDIILGRYAGELNKTAFTNLLNTVGAFFPQFTTLAMRPPTQSPRVKYESRLEEVVSAFDDVADPVGAVREAALKLRSQTNFRELELALGAPATSEALSDAHRDNASFLVVTYYQMVPFILLRDRVKRYWRDRAVATVGLYGAHLSDCMTFLQTYPGHHAQFIWEYANSEDAPSFRDRFQKILQDPEFFKENVITAMQESEAGESATQLVRATRLGILRTADADSCKWKTLDLSLGIEGDWRRPWFPFRPADSVSVKK